jgi:uncharacterized cupin superfamily protein
VSEAPSVVNVDELAGELEATNPAGYRVLVARLGPLLRAEALGASLYELPPGQSIRPYHYEHGREEWLIVLSGRPLLRTPAGEETLAEGDVVLFAEGPEGAHKVTNTADAAIRVLMLSNASEVAIGVYPDSGKVGILPGRRFFRTQDAVDYWEGEA